MRLRPCGDAAVLAELDDLAGVLALARAIEEERAAGGLEQLIDVVPAARTVLLRCVGGAESVRTVAARIRELRTGGPELPAGRQVQLPVRYDGPDLAEVGRLSGLAEAEVVRLHTAATWTVAFTGFAPGFGYLVGGDQRLRVPRRAEPRTRVPAGSVGLAGEFTGAYPRESPGGWQLIGRTDAVLWEPDRDPPALLAPGTRVRFLRVGP